MNTENQYYTASDTILPDALFSDIWRWMDAWDWVMKRQDELFQRWLYHKENELRSMSESKFWTFMRKRCIEEWWLKEVIWPNWCYYVKVRKMEDVKNNVWWYEWAIRDCLDGYEWCEDEFNDYCVDIYMWD
jgi:hypothetical protein